MPPNRAVREGRSVAGYTYPKGVYCLLALDRLKFSRFLVTKTSANKRFYNMSETYPERTIAKRFSQDIFPSSVGIGGKGTEKFADVQIFQLKVWRLRFKDREIEKLLLATLAEI